MVTHFPEDGHQPSPGWSPTIPRMVNYHPQDGHPPLKGMVTHHPQGGHPPTVKWWITIPGMVVTVPRTVTHHFQDGQLDLEIDSRAAQLVSFNVVQCPHPNCSPHQQSMWGVPPFRVYLFTYPNCSPRQESMCGVPPPSTMYFSAFATLGSVLDSKWNWESGKF